MARKYFTLMVRENGAFAPQFGDWQKAVVKEEMILSYRQNHKAKDMKIVETDGTRIAIFAAARKLNEDAMWAKILG